MEEIKLATCAAAATCECHQLRHRSAVKMMEEIKLVTLARCSLHLIPISTAGSSRIDPWYSTLLILMNATAAVDGARSKCRIQNWTAKGKRTTNLKRMTVTSFTILKFAASAETLFNPTHPWSMISSQPHSLLKL